MNIRFHPKLKTVEEAFVTRNPKLLKKKWNRFAEDIIDALDVVASATTLADLGQMKWLHPHQLYKNKRYPYERYSLSPCGKSNAARITLVCFTADWQNRLTEIDYTVTAVLVEEVDNHYGD